MNLINVLFNIRNIFFLFLTLVISRSAYAQVIINTDYEPIIADFLLPGMFSDQNISDALFDDYGTLYLSTNNKIGIFNGNKWKFVSTNGYSSLEKTSDGRLYILDKTGPGTIILDSLLQYKIKYLKNLTPYNHLDSRKFDRILCLEDKTFLEVNDSLFAYDDGRLIFKMESQKDSKIKKTENFIFLKSEGEYFRIQNNSISALGLKTSSEILFSEYKNLLVYYDKAKKTVNVLDSVSHGNLFELPINDDVSFFTSLNDECFLFLTKENRIIITDISGNLRADINSLSEEENSFVSKILTTINQKFLLINDKKVSVIDYPSSSYKIHINNSPGKIIDLISFNKKLYLLTEKGLFSADHKLNKLSDENGYKLLPAGDFFLMVQKNQLSAFNNSCLKTVISTQINSFSWDEKNKDILIKDDSAYTFYSGISSLGFKNKKTISIDPRAQFVYLDSSKIYFVSGSFLIIQDLKDGSYLKIKIPEIITRADLYGIFKSGSLISLLTSDAVFSLKNKKFEKQEKLSSLVKENADFWYEINNKYLAFLALNDWAGPAIKIFSAQNNIISSLKLPIDFHLNKLNIKFLNDSNIFLFNDRSVYLCNIFPDIHQKFPISITGVQAGDQNIFSDINYELSKAFVSAKLNAIPYANNDLIIEISSNDFVSGMVKHQYNFSGKEANWSEWKFGSDIKFNDLDYGKHHLRIRLQNAEGGNSNTLNIKFSILSPFYLSWYAFTIYIIFALIIFFLLYKTYIFNRHKLRKASEEIYSPTILHKADIPEENKKNEFLTNINDLENERKSKWDKYEMATVLFSDIQGFTKIAEQTNPEVLIDELDKFFFHFDSVVEKYNIEKIKTIGDAYMAAGGIPKKNSSNPIEVVLAALEMQQYMKELKNSRTEIWDLRIGIHSGPVIAGVIGQKKRSYDIWGDTVNTASRMESSGEPGKVNISGLTYQLIKDYFICDYRGRIPVKYKGNIDMYFVRGLRPELSVNLAGIPNRKFFLNIQLLRLQDLEDHVFNKLDEELSKNLYFHNSEYARHIYRYSALLAKAENLDIEETLLIRTSALLLFIGYTINFIGHEKISSQISYDILKDFGYSEKQATQISNLILATKLPAEPQNLLEKIIIDVSLEYLGRVDYIKLYKLQFLEYNQFNKPIETREWKSRQIEFLKKHEFFTSGGRRLREVSAQEQIHRIEEDIW
jgi:adenylate cyclase